MNPSVIVQYTFYIMGSICFLAGSVVGLAQYIKAVAP